MEKMKLLIALALVGAVRALTFHDVSSTVGFGPATVGYVGTMSDFTADHRVDVVLVNDTNLQVFSWSDGHFKIYRRAGVAVDRSRPVRSVLSADFDGDSLQDLLVTVESNHGKLSLVIHWGVGYLNYSTEITADGTVEPVLADLNGDLLPDILSSTLPNRNLEAWCSQRFWWGLVNCTKAFVNPPQLVSNPQPSFVDIDGDLHPEIVLPNNNGLEFWQNTTGNWRMSGSLRIPNSKVIGQAAWADMDLDGHLDLILPVCEDQDCRHSSIRIMLQSKPEHDLDGSSSLTQSFKEREFNFSLALNTLSLATGSVHFSTHRKVPFSKLPSLLPSLHTADLDLDTYPDFITVVHPVSDSSISQVLLLRNVPCEKGCPQGVRRTLQAEIVPKTMGAFSVASIDLGEDGIPDLVVNRQTANHINVSFLRQDYTSDSAFVKVVVTGHCNRSCSVKHGGGPFIGTVVTFGTTNEQGHKYHSTAAVLSSVGTLTLQLPYAIFGLGRAPNFVESITTSLPSYGGVKRTHKWQAIIPNSQVLILASPTDNPDRWTAHLLLSPSRAVWQTVIVFSSTCAVMLLAIVLLHLREKREDEQEKRLGAHRFHFDAM